MSYNKRWNKKHHTWENTYVWQNIHRKIEFNRKILQEPIIEIIIIYFELKQKVVCRNNI